MPSGGPLNMDIVTRKKAIANINKLSKMLEPEGFVIATGQTAVLLKGKQFAEAGLKVLSYSTPCTTPKGYENNEFIKISHSVAGFFNHYQRYVCQKPAAVEKKEDFIVAPGGPTP